VVHFHLESTFKDEGLDVTYSKFLLGREAINDVVKGNSDVATVFETPVVRRIYEGDPLQILTSLHSSTKNTALIGLKSHGIKTVNDLRGKKLGYTKYITSEFFLRSFLTTEGINANDLTLIAMEPDEINKALSTGTIDGAAIFNPHLFALQKSLKDDALVIYSNTYTEISTLTGTENFAKHRGPAITKLLRALVKAEVFAKAHKQESIQIVDEWLQNVDEETVAGTWDSVDRALELDNRLLTILTREARFLKDQGVYTSEVPDYRKHIYSNYLKQVKPEGVTIY